MCHFDLTYAELGMKGKWIIKTPEKIDLPSMTNYLVTWVETTE
jgi:hypothetical protein